MAPELSVKIEKKTPILANTDRKCKFWERNWLCKAGVGGCSVEACREDDIPTGIKGSVEKVGCCVIIEIMPEHTLVMIMVFTSC